MSFKSLLVKKYVQIKSWKTNKKIIVIESDDWGSLRTKDQNALNYLLKVNPELKNDKFTCLDSIANEEDLSLLFEVLTSVKDSLGNHAKITANACMANPDFKKIAATDFTDFFYEPFFETIQRRSDGRKILNLWHDGIKNRIFVPQLHGREHVNALAWLDELRHGNHILLKAFEVESWGVPYKSYLKQRRKNLMAALDIYGIDGEFEFQKKWIEDSVKIFESYFGYKSTTFIPPAYTWHYNLGPTFIENGIEAIQGISLHFEPNLKNWGKFRKSRIQINGNKDKFGLFRIARNAFFEPFSNAEKDWVNSCFQRIEFAFKSNQPAIIGSHRINFIGSLDQRNRDNHLKQLKKLLTLIRDKYPDIIFMSSNELLEEFKNK